MHAFLYAVFLSLIELTKGRMNLVTRLDIKLIAESYLFSYFLKNIIGSYSTKYNNNVY